MNLPFSNAINTPDFLYGFMYQTKYWGRNANLRPVTTFQQTMRTDLQRHLGLLNDIANEMKKSTKLIT